jgi:cysteine synthase A
MHDLHYTTTTTTTTTTGCTQYLKTKNPHLHVVAVEPSESAVLSGEPPGPHKIQGIGAGFIPTVLETELISEIIKIPSDVSIDTSREIACKEGIFVGM